MRTRIVETRHGRLEGRESSSGVFFGGVPFASAPVGELRFAPPGGPRPWTGVRNAQSPGAAAPQLSVTRMGPISWLSRMVRGPMSEDCLTLNLTTPAVDDRKRPVLVWFHGGAFVLGAGSTFLYDPSSLVGNGDVVVVSPNYRLGALGFLDLTSLSSRAEAPSNLGLRDQIAALEWVRDNISAFGGDPARVTVFGESAGAMSLGVLLAVAPHLFHRAILQSGATANVATRAESAYVAERFLAATGLGANDLEGLRRLPVDDILEAQRAVLLGESSRMGRLPWQPSIDGDLLTSRPGPLIEQGVARDVRVLVGTNLDEWKLFTSAAVALRAMSFDELERRIERMLGRIAEPGARDPRRAMELYREVTRIRGSPQTAYEAWVAFRTDDYFRIPAIALADALSAGGSRVYLYRFDQPIPAFRTALGACHAAEVPLVFSTHRTRWLKPIYLGRRKIDELSDVLEQAWLSFSAQGAPKDSAAGDWPRHARTDRVTRILGAPGGLEPVVRDPESDTRAFWMSS